MKPKLLIVDAPEINLNEMKIKIVADFASLGLNLRYANLGDITKIDRLFYSRYSSKIAGEVSPYETMRTIEYGHIIILEDINDDIVACQYFVPYHTKFKISYAMRLAVHKSFEGNYIAFKLYKFLTIVAIENGCIFQDSLISLDNIFMHNMLLNKMGAKYTGFIKKDLPGIYHHTVSRLSLNSNELFKSVSRSTCYKFLSETSQEKYALVRLQDSKKISDFFENKTHEIVALIWPSWFSKINEPMFLFTTKDQITN